MSRQCGPIFDNSSLRQDVKRLQEQSMAQDLWDDPSAAELLMKSLKGKEKMLQQLTQLLDDFEVYQEMATDGEKELIPMVENLLERNQKLKVILFLSGKFDQNDAIVSLYAGAGGKDAQDWAEMLLRMIVRYCEQQEWSIDILDRNDAEEVGIKSVTLEIKGHMAYGLLKSEHGVHRLVRLSPFNAGNTRETSFAKIDVLPLVEEDLSVEIPDDDLKIDVFRASGKGGQGVNTTDSAVRITHIPTGLTVQCQNQRSQLQNKKTAMGILSSKLVQLKEEQHAERIQDLKGTQQEAAWGNQIRSYVLHPYQMVKDHRTNVESSQTDKVLNGDITEFVEGFLRQD